MTHASVFSGIGGPEVAATMLGWTNLFHCEINPFGRAVLDYWYPNAKSYEDITTTDFSEWRGKVDVLTGGFPCQPFSYAGQRRGAQDDRYLWPFMFRCIDAVRPRWVVAENVAGILTMVEQGEVSGVETQGSLFDEADAVRRYRLRETFTLQRICDDLEGHGYAVQPVLIPACAVGAPHRRDRVFIVGRRRDGETAVADTDERTD
jgi:DNA (cytosine-5)-methyltransferase 1